MRKWLTFRQWRGGKAERLAARYLASQGFRIIETNVRFKAGELDIVAYEGKTLCFIEVRSVASDYWGGPFASLTYPKRQRLIRAARLYLARLAELPAETRFDAVGITWKTGSPPSITLIRSAFEATSSH